MQRNLDELGRVVIPKEMRKELNIEGGDPINIELQNNKVIITKPDTVDYKAIVEEAIEYINNYETIRGYYEYQECGYDEYNYEEDLKENLLGILKGKKD